MSPDTKRQTDLRDCRDAARVTAPVRNDTARVTAPVCSEATAVATPVRNDTARVTARYNTV